MSPATPRRAWRWVLSRLHRRVGDAHRHFGNIHANQEEHWAAVGHYTRAALLDPDYALAYYSRGVLYWREIGKPDRAIHDLTRVLQLDPAWAEAYFNRGLAYKMRRAFDRAIDDFERYVAIGDDPFWLDSARRQLDELYEAGAGPSADDASSPDP